MRGGDKGVPELEDWLLQHLSPGQCVGIDPDLVSAAQVNEGVKRWSMRVNEGVSEGVHEGIDPPRRSMRVNEVVDGIQ